MTQKLRIACCQFPVSCNIESNAKFTRRFTKKVAESGAHVIHFPETALSGYERADFTPSNNENWKRLEEQMEEIANLAGNLGLWVVLGSCRKVRGSEKPANCIHVISDTGQIIGTYDKQMLTSPEFAW